MFIDFLMLFPSGGFSGLLLCVVIFGAAAATEFDLGTLTLNRLKLLGDAHWNNGSIHLTPDLAVPTSTAGRALYAQPIRFREQGNRFLASFSTFFSFSVTSLNPFSVGGGLAFVIVPEDQTVGSGGACLGLAGQMGAPALREFVAVEFDTLMDVEFEDINGNHVGLDLNLMVSTEVADLATVSVDLKSGDLVNAWISYDASARVLNVSVSYSNLKPKEALLSVDLDLEAYLDDLMFVGFSGSTQGSTELHSVEWWSFSSTFDSEFPPMTPSSAPDFAGNISESSSSSSCHNQLCKKGRGAVAGVVTASACSLALFAGVLIWVLSKRFKQSKKSETLDSKFIRLPKEFRYKELKSATKCFDPDKIIGHGAFGTVYKGVFPDTGDAVAVKRCIHQDGKGKSEFLSELSVISALRHRNLVRLQGWCHEKGEILLVYDLMPNGSLDKVLFEARRLLPWHHRRKVLMGVASALTYLHQECENQVIHRDVKSSNIMLDEFFNARLGDFGLARQVEHDKSPDATVAAGTMGYLAPEYLLTGRATEKTDVFSYGAVVLEVACGRRPIEKESTAGVSRRGGRSLVEWVWGLHGEGKLLTVADERLRGEFEPEEMMRVLMIGLACSHPDPAVRPTMRAVVQMLAGEAEVPVPPRSRPSTSFSTTHLLMSLQDSVSDCNAALLTVSSSSSSSSPDTVVGNELV